MDTKQFKFIQIAVAAVCLATAGVVLYVHYFKNENFSGSDEPVPMICLACEHTCELSVQGFQALIIRQGPDIMHSSTEGPRFVCPNCGQKTLQTGFKCSRCGEIFASEARQSLPFLCRQCRGKND